MKKTIIITGASDGIGAAAARQLHASGNQVVLVGRSPEKTRALADELEVDYYLADFAHLHEVAGLADQLLTKYSQIDVLANNAGLIWQDRTLTDDGNEITFQVNHLAPFLLTMLLRERLVASKATVINTASSASMMGRIDLDDLQNERNYGSFRAYADSKLANIMFAKELDRRWGPDGVAAASFHPGLVFTNFGKSTNRMFDFLFKLPGTKLFTLSPDEGADTLAWLATTKPGVDWQPGQYYTKRKLAFTHKQVADDTLTSGLWERSEQLLSQYL